MSETPSFPLSDAEVPPDWTLDRPGIVFQECGSCGDRWYFRRRFCPACGSEGPTLRQASGVGIVYAVTEVHRAPTEELRSHAPYTIVLIDAEEGFRMMAHGAPGLVIGGKVRAGWRTVAGKLLPFYESDPHE